jgi:hypothetical protein
MPPAVRRLRRVFLSAGLPLPEPLSPGQSVGRGQGCPDSVAVTFSLDSPQVENLRPLQATCGHFGRSKNAAADGTPVDAARGQALASHSSCHRAFRSRSRMSLGQASFAVRVTQIWWLSPFSPRFGGCHLFSGLRRRHAACGPAGASPASRGPSRPPRSTRARAPRPERRWSLRR